MPDRVDRAIGVACLTVLAIVAVSCGSDASTSGDTSGDDATTVQAVADRFADETRGGIAIAVAGEAGPVERTTAGVATRAGHEPVDDETAFRVASVTKTFLAALTLTLVDDGLLELDASLGSVFGGDAGRWSAVTLRQLLTHTSGLPRTGPRVDPSTWRSPADIDLEPLCDPGACRNYADENFVVAGLVIAHVAGQPLERALRARILEPFDLDRTFLAPAETPTPPIARHPTRAVVKALPGVVTTAADLARFGQALFGGQVLRESSLDAMLDFDATADIPCAEECHLSFPYGLGVFDFSGVVRCPFVGHDGSTSALLAYVPSRRQTIAVVSNVEPWPDDLVTSVLAAATDGQCA